MNRSAAPRWAMHPLALCALIATGAHAADAAPEQVIVTAQSRSQQAQTVPITMQVLAPDEVRKLGAANLGDLNGYLPGLTVDATQPTQPAISLRGISTDDFLIGTDSPVGVYIDGVYAGKTGGALLNFNDIKRIEVLKGPQGTLFGRNSAGGAIAVVTNAPVARFDANGLVRIGNQGARQAQAMLNQPLGEDWALRVSAVAQRSHGWVRDAGNTRREGGEDAWGTRVALRWSASDRTSATLSWEHEKLDQRSRPAFGVVAEPADGSALPYPADPARYLDPKRAPLLNDVDDSREARTFDGATLRIEHGLGWAELTSTTAWRHFNARNRQDNDGTRRAISQLVTTNVEASTSWQQEFKLTGRHGAFDWLAGASFYAERAEQSSQIATNTTALDAMFGNIAGLPAYSTLNMLAQLAGIEGLDLLGQGWEEAMNNRARNRAVALYGDVIWQLAPATRLTAGLRLTRDRKRFSWTSPARQASSLDAQLDALDAAGFYPALLAAGALGPEDAAALQALTRQAQLIDGRGATGAPLQVERHWSDTSPRLVIDQRLGQGWMGFASITRGYQAGGFNGLAVNGQYEPERVTNAELGLKGAWPAQGLAFNAALFRYRFSNLQTLELVPSGNASGIPAYQVTVSDQQATGIDLDGQWQVSPGLRLFGAAEGIDQTYRRRRAADGTDMAGQPTGTPRWTLSAGFETRWAVGGGQASLRASGAVTSAMRCNAETEVQGTCLATPAFRVGGPRHRLDTRLGWDAAGGRWGVALVVNNATDERTITRLWRMAEGLGAPYVTMTPPRRVMLELRAAL